MFFKVSFRKRKENVFYYCMEYNENKKKISELFFKNNSIKLIIINYI